MKTKLLEAEVGGPGRAGVIATTVIALASYLIAVPSNAATLYSNGPNAGNAYNYNAEQISCNGCAVSDPFSLGGTSTVTGIDFAAWLGSPTSLSSVACNHNCGIRRYDGSFWDRDLIYNRN
jgi:hypothetical protein